MTPQEVQRHVEESLKKVAPEVNFAALDLHKNFRSQVEIDSYDLYNMLSLLEKSTDVRVPESALREIQTLAELIAFIAGPSREVPASAGP